MIAGYIPDEVNRTKIKPGISDHETPYIELSVAPTYKKQVPRQVWLFQKAGWQAMSYCLEPKLKLLNSYNPCPDKLWIDLKEIILYSTIEVGCAHCTNAVNL